MATQTLEQIIAAAVAAALAEQNAAGLVTAPPAPVPAPATPPVAIDAAAATQVAATVAYVAESRKGAQIEGDKSWYNAPKGGGKVWDGFAKGDRVLMSLNADGRVLAVERVGTESAPKAAAPKAAAPKAAAPKAAAPKAAPAAPAPTPTANDCVYCGGKHYKYKAEQVRRDCAERQYATVSGEAVTLADPASLIRFAVWLSERALTVFAYNAVGVEILGTEPEPEPTPPAPSGPKGGKGKATAPAAPAPQAAAPAPRKGGRKAATDAEIIAAGERLVAAPQAAAPAPAPKAAPAPERQLTLAQQRVGTWDGLLAAHPTSTPNTTAGLLKFVSATLPGCKPAGDWIAPIDSKLVGPINAANVNDRVRVTLNATGHVVAFEVLGEVAKETGHRAGIETSGKQQPPAPKKQPVDQKVATARREAAAARKAAKAEAATPGNVTDVDAVLNARHAKQQAASRQKAAERATTESVEAAEQAAALGRKGATVRVNRKTKNLEVLFPCSGTTTHRTSCFGRCVA